jgi:electron transport complex protein RnfC
MRGEAAASVLEMPCIRCGDCATACPAQLQPQQLLFELRAGRLPQAEQQGLLDCTQCGRCDEVCPSRIALLSRFIEGKAALALQTEQKRQAFEARERYQSRNARLQREAIERVERETALTEQASSTDAVAAAIERAKARRQQGKDRP